MLFIERINWLFIFVKQKKTKTKKQRFIKQMCFTDPRSLSLGDTRMKQN